MKDETIVVMTALICVFGYGIFALLKGIDSTVTAMVSGSIGTILGYYFGKKKGEEK